MRRIEASRILRGLERKISVMKLMDVMMRNVKTCSIDARLADVVRLMVENNCGCIPLTDAEDVVVAMITDRDVCIAAYEDGRPLAQIAARSGASPRIYLAHLDDTIEKVGGMMEMYKVRRLPIVDALGRVVGIVTLGDIAQRAAQGHNTSTLGLRNHDIVRAIAAVSGPASPWFDASR